MDQSWVSHVGLSFFVGGSGGRKINQLWVSHVGNSRCSQITVWYFCGVVCSLFFSFARLGRPFWAKPVLRRFSGPRRSKLFCRWFCFLLGKRSAYRLLLEPTWSLRLVAWLFAAKRRRISLLHLRWLLEVFLAVAEFVGFRTGCRLPFEWLYWILYCPLLAPLAPLDSYRIFQPRKNMNCDFFQSIPLLINSINLKRDGVRICLGKDVERWSIEGFLTPPLFRCRVNYIG